MPKQQDVLPVLVVLIVPVALQVITYLQRILALQLPTVWLQQQLILVHANQPITWIQLQKHVHHAQPPIVIFVIQQLQPIAHLALLVMCYSIMYVIRLSVPIKHITLSVLDVQSVLMDTIKWQSIQWNTVFNAFNLTLHSYADKIQPFLPVHHKPAQLLHQQLWLEQSQVKCLLLPTTIVHLVITGILRAVLHANKVSLMDIVNVHHICNALPSSAIHHML